MSVVDDYLNGFEGIARERLDQTRAALRQAARDAEEVISYGIPTLDLNGRHVVHFAGFKHHVGLYPTPRGIEDFAAELSAFPQGKGSVQFPHDRPLPVELIERIGRHLADLARAAPRKKSRKASAQSPRPA